MSALAQIDALILDLEAELGLAHGEHVPGAASPAASKGEKKNKKEKAKKAAPKAVAPMEEEDKTSPNQLEFRVGLITKVWEHPDSEKLFCEEIDIGEAKGPRSIASGLRAFYKLEQLQDRLVVVMANLKGRNLGGFKSEGMVVCASAPDHSSVELLSPPEGSKPGDLLTFAGIPGKAISPAQVQKRKLLETILPRLRTNASGVPCCDGSDGQALGLATPAGEGGGEGQSSGGSCGSSLPNALVG